MNNPFDELAKDLAQSVTRRGALKRLGIGLAVALLSSLGLPSKAEALSNTRCYKHCQNDCAKTNKHGTPEWESCWQACAASACGG